MTVPFIIGMVLLFIESFFSSASLVWVAKCMHKAAVNPHMTFVEEGGVPLLIAPQYEDSVEVIRYQAAIHKLMDAAGVPVTTS